MPPHPAETSSRPIVNLPLATILFLVLYRVTGGVSAVTERERQDREKGDTGAVEAQTNNPSPKTPPSPPTDPYVVLEAINAIFNPDPSATTSAEEWKQYVGSGIVADAWERFCGSIVQE